MADYKIEIEADVARALSSIENLTDQVEELTKEFSNTDKGISSFASKMISVRGVIDTAKDGFALAKSGLNALSGALQEAGQIEGLTRGFENLQASIGAVANDSLVSLKNATKGMVSDLELMEAANNAVLLGVDDGSGKFAEMTEAAIKLGQAAGRTATEAINDLTVGIGRGSKQILDNLGVIVDANKAYENFAKANGLVAEKLTDAQKKAAFQAEAFGQVTEKASKLPGVADTAATSFTKLTKAFEDQRVSALKALSDNEDLSEAIDELAKAIKNIDFKPLIDGLSTVATVAFDATRWILEVVQGIGAAENERVFVSMVEQIERLDSGLAKLFENTRRRAQSATTAEDIAIISKAMEVLEDRIADADKQTVFYAERALGILQKEVNTASTVVDKFATKDIPKITKALTEQDDTLESVTKKIKEYQSTVALGPGGDPNAANIWDDFFKGLGPEYEQIGNQLGRDLTDGMLSGIQIALEGGNSEDYGAAFGGPIGGAIGSIFGPAGAQIGSQLGQIFGPAIFGGISDAFDSVFGNNDEQANAREGFEGFIRDAIEGANLQVIIDGKLQELDFSITGGRKAFNGEDGGLFATAFEGIDESAKSAFIGIGEALNSLLDTGEDIGAQFGAIFSDQVGGDLNNLQLLLEATGLSAGQMGDAVREAFLDGNLSAIEALDSLRAIEDIMAKGIPGTTGAIDKAFNNLVTGSGRGRQAVDAVGDIFAEAAEIGISSMDDLRQRLIDLGTPIEQVDQLFAAFEERGITSVEQGLNQSLDQTIQILADLESQGFDFAGTLGQEVDAVTKGLEEIENFKFSDKELNINVNVEGTGISPGTSLSGLDQELENISKSYRTLAATLSENADLIYTAINGGYQVSGFPTAQPEPTYADVPGGTIIDLSGQGRGGISGEIIQALNEIPNETKKKIVFEVEVTGDSIPGGTIIDIPGAN